MSNVVDTFNRSDDFVTLNTADSGQTWRYFGGDARWAIISNTAQPFQSMNILSGIVINAGTPNAITECTMSHNGGQQPGFVFRMAGDSGYWTWYKNDSNSSYPVTSSMRLSYWTSGSETVIATDSVVFPSNTNIYNISCDGSNQITCKFNGATIRSVNNATYNTGTEYGFAGFYNTGTSADNFTVTAISGIADHIGIVTQPGNATSSVVFGTQPVVQARDSSNSVAFGYTGSFTASLVSGSGVLAGTLTQTPVSGTATFTNLKITGVGPAALGFSAPGLTSITSSLFQVASFVGPADHMSMSRAPSVTSVSTNPFTIQPIINVVDVNGSLTSYTGSVTATMASGSGILIGTVTKAAVGGVVTYTDLGINGPGPATVLFSATGISPTSASITVASASLAIPSFYYFLTDVF